MNSTAAVSVLGAGSWGTALACVLARNGVSTTLWGRDESAVAAMAESHHNVRYLPDLELPATLKLTADLPAAVRGADILLIVTPSHAFAELLTRIRPDFRDGAALAWATKGFDPRSGKFLHEIVAEDFPNAPSA